MFQTLAEVTYDYSTSTSYDTGTGSLADVGIILVIALVVVVAMLIAVWKVFTKAGKPGWAAIVPIYNAYILTEIAGRPGWWTLLMFIPYVNYVILLLISIDIAKAFGKSTAFGVVGLWLFGPVGYAMLGFGSATYQGPRPTNLAAAPAGAPAPAAPSVQPVAPVPPATPTAQPTPPTEQK